MNQERWATALSVAIALAVGATAVEHAAFAQAPQGAQAQQNQSDQSKLEEVVVTGSRIARPDYTANSPIVTVSDDLLNSTGAVSIETVLNQLPQFVPQYNQFVSQNIQPSALGTPGASTVSLRGLGANRTLVLIDGRRGVPINATNAVDTNSIPTAAIQRVEIVSGGASAVYGADAMAGVVNFILKDDFEGFQVDTQEGATEVGDGQEFRVSAIAGTHLPDDRGNFMVSVEYAKREPALQINRDWRVSELRNPYLSGSEFGSISETSIRNNSVIVDTCADPSTPGVDCALDVGNPFSQTVVDSLFPGASGAAIAPGTLPSTRAAGSYVSADANPVITNWYVNPTPNGTGSVFTGVWAGQGGFNRTTNGSPAAPGAYKYTGPLTSPDCGDAPYRKIMADGSITQNDCAVRYSAPLDRYTLFGLGRYKVGDNVTAIIRGNLSRSHTTTVYDTIAATSVWDVQVPHSNAIYTGNAALQIPSSLNADGTTNAAYLPGGAYGLSCPATGGCTVSQVWPTPPEVTALLDSRPNPNAPFQVDQYLTYFPRRSTDSLTNSYQFMLGLEGKLGNDWSWDASASYGETVNVTNQPNYVARERLRTLENRPNYGHGAVVIGNLEQFGVFGGRTTCATGLPVFSKFTPSDDCLDAIRADIQNNSLAQQKAVEANLTGSAFKLPAGTVGFSVGADYRTNFYKFVGDSLTNANATTDQTLGLFPLRNSAGSQTVAEFYGELLVPVVPRFDLEMGGRYSDYDTSGSVNTYKLLANWRMTDFARFRGGVNRAIRAPNIAELFLSPTQSAGGFGAPAALYGDPCSLNPATASPAPFGALSSDSEQAARALTICRALMGQTGAAVYYGRPTTQQPDSGGLGSTFTAGNPNVQPETADTWTAGFVIDSPFKSSPWLAGARATIDYWNIAISGIISVESPDEPYRRCLSQSTNPSGDITNASCAAIKRDPTSGNGGTVDVVYTNSGEATFSGIDLQLDWRGDFADLGGLRWIPGSASVNVLLSAPLEMKTRTSPEAPEIDWKGTQGCALQLQCGGYDYQVLTTVNYMLGPWRASMRWSHVPSIEDRTAATNPDTPFVGIPDSADMITLSGSYEFNDKLTLRFGIENAFDQLPPLEGGNPNATPLPLPAQRAGANFGVDFGQVPLGTYDPLGRRYYLGLNWALK